MATLAQPEGIFDIGRVIQRTFAVIGRNAALFGIAALLIVGVPTILVGVAVPNLALGTEQALGGFSPTVIVVGFLGWLFWMLLSLVLQATLIRATIFDLAGERANLGDSLRIAVGLALPLLGLSIVTSLGVAFASVFLIVPGIMLYCAWSVAVSALVEERRGVFASLGRSRALTKGSRWKIFALLLIFMLASLLFQAAFGLLGGITGDAAGPQSLVQIILQALLSSVTTMVGAAGVASMYVELRSAKEGASFANLAEIFS